MQVKLSPWLVLVAVQAAGLAGATPGIAIPEPRSSLPEAPAPAQPRLTQPLNEPATDFKAALAGKPVVGAVTSKSPSLTQLSIPSLWWISKQLADLEQFGNKFIQLWLAYPGQNGQPGRVDLLVDRQQWSLLTLVQRYEFVHKFSTTARGYGFNTRVYDNPGRVPLALYVCDFSPVAAQLLSSSAFQLSPTEISTRSALSNQLTCTLNLAGANGRRLLPN